MSQTVAVVGASDKPERYSNRALKLLAEHRHQVYPVHPRLEEIEGRHCYKSLEELKESRMKIDTVTMYVGASISDKLEKQLIALRPERVIFNPGAENPRLESVLKENGIETLEACTLVLLGSGKF